MKWLVDGGRARDGRAGAWKQCMTKYTEPRGERESRILMLLGHNGEMENLTNDRATIGRKKTVINRVILIIKNIKTIFFLLFVVWRENGKAKVRELGRYLDDFFPRRDDFRSPSRR